MAYEVYSFKQYSKELDINFIASLLKDGMELKKKDLQMLKNKFEEQKCFYLKNNKKAVESGRLKILMLDLNLKRNHQPHK